ncbi:hypothetical protein [Paraburkholderia sp. D1E]|uniref:hypothetical protein n=1 Tax=Paraburkholderia sp. D1E TaxID=3461398 RepID=UPI004045EC65
MTTVQERVRAPRTFTLPRLDAWSVRQAEPVDITGDARADYERELRISALGSLICASGATPLWRRVCLREMMSEIRARSADQRLLMELAIAESMRGQS